MKAASLEAAFLLSLAGLFLPDCGLHHAQDVFRFSILKGSRGPFFLQAKLRRLWNDMKMHVHHFLSRASTIVLNDGALFHSGRGTRGASNAGQHPANTCGRLFT